MIKHYTIKSIKSQEAYLHVWILLISLEFLNKSQIIILLIKHEGRSINLK